MSQQPAQGNQQQQSGISTNSKLKAEATKSFLQGHYKNMLRSMSAGQVAKPINQPRDKELRPEDFKQLKIIGRGAFGEVFICKLKEEANDPNAPLYAMKRMKKSDMLRKRKVFHVRSERNVLAQAKRGCPWIVDLHFSFQDDFYLYMVMDYMAGGDLMTWLCNEGIFSVEATRFYIAELCLAVDAVHQMEYVHRDIKPDNILMDLEGHTKLSDFGLCKAFPKNGDGTVVDLYQELEQELSQQAQLQGSMVVTSASMSAPAGSEAHPSLQQQQPSTTSTEPVNTASSGNQPPADGANPTSGSGSNPSSSSNRRVQFNSIVGSPGYIAPEILLRQPYTQSCDWWSVGVIMYEMLYGRTPFYHEDAQTTCHMITHFREYLQFPGNRGIPESAVDLLKKLLTDQNQRINMDQIKEHPFFAGVDWDEQRTAPAVYRPVLSDPLDVKYFPPQEELIRPAGRGGGLTQADAQVKVEDPRGVLFADFNFDYRKAQREEAGGAGGRSGSTPATAGGQSPVHSTPAPTGDDV